MTKPPTKIFVYEADFPLRFILGALWARLRGRPLQWETKLWIVPPAALYASQTKIGGVVAKEVARP